MNHRAVILLSGGIDSSTALAVAKSEGHEVYAISIDYHQRHRVEIESARLVAAAIGVEKHLIISFDLSEIGGSALTTDVEVPKLDKEETGRIWNRAMAVDSKDSLLTRSVIPATYVPARNTIFLSLALAWAEVLNAQEIFIGANAIDYSGYPDCRPEYLRAFEKMANLATKASVEGKLTFRVKAPLLSMTKAEIIRKGMELGVDYSLTWSCYEPRKNREASSGRGNKSENDSHQPFPFTRYAYVPCRRCDSCRFRAKGFMEAGIRDPLITPGIDAVQLEEKEYF
jgi:7-cyano-7-deazaguanine synthase